MNCPICQSTQNEVVDSRPWCDPQTGQTGTRRRRACSCGERFTTIEVAVTLAQGGGILGALKVNARTNRPAKPARKRTEKAKTDIKKKLAMALHRARVQAVTIEDEDLE